MKILHAIPSVARIYGGPSTAVAALAAAQNRLPEIVAEVAATDADGDGRFDPSSWPNEAGKLHLFPTVAGPGASLRAWLDKRIADYDVMHIHSLWNSVVYYARRAAVRRGIPIVLRPCGMMSDYTWSRRPLLKYGYWWLRERGDVSSSAAIHCTSDAEAAEVRGHKVVRGTIQVIPNGVESAAFTVPRTAGELRRRVGSMADGKRLLLFLSRLHPKKGIVDLLLPALAAIGSNSVLAIAGGPDIHAPGHDDEIRTAIAALGLTDRVAMLGNIEPAERWSLFDDADAFVLPSHSENFGIVVAESMARGCPILVTSGVQSHEHVSAARAGVVVEPNVGSVLEGLKALAGMDREDAAKRSRDYAAQHFDWNRIAERTIAMYESIIPARANP